MWSSRSDAVVGSACGYADRALGGLGSPAAQSHYVRGKAYCAAHPTIFASGAGCGACFWLSAGGVSKIVQIVSKVDPGDITFTCHAAVFGEISGARDGVLSINYEPVPCETDSCPKAIVAEDPSASFTQIIFADLPHPVTAARASLGTKVFPMTRSRGALWEFAHPNDQTGEASFFLSLANGEETQLHRCLSSIWPRSTGDTCQECAGHAATVPLYGDDAPWTGRGAFSLEGLSAGTVWQAAFPNPFYSIVHARMAVRVDWANATPSEALVDGLITNVQDSLSNFTWGHEPALVKAIFPQTAALLKGEALVRMDWKFRSRSGQGTLELCQELNDEDHRARLNRILLAEAGGKRAAAAARRLTGAAAAIGDEAFGADQAGAPGDVERPRLGCLMDVPVGTVRPVCTESLAVTFVEQLAGVFITYQYCLPFAFVWVLLVALTLWPRLWKCCGLNRDLAKEVDRGTVVLALFVVNVLCASAFVLTKAARKYDMLADLCLGEMKDPNKTWQCPPTASALLLEVIFGACVPAGMTGLWVVWCWDQWQRSFVIEKESLTANSGSLMPFEAVLGRNTLLSLRNLAWRDASRHSEPLLLAIFHYLCALTVLLFSFVLMALARFPNRTMAWQPYKMIVEAGVTQLLCFIMQKLVRGRIPGRWTLLFLQGTVGVFASLAIALLMLTIRACLKLGLTGRHFVLFLDICIGAPIINLCLANFIWSVGTHLFSVYNYQPLIRADRIHTFCLRSPDEAQQLASRIATGNWELRGRPLCLGRPCVVTGLNDEDAGSGSDDDSDHDYADGAEEAPTSPAKQAPSLPLMLAVPTTEEPVLVELVPAGEGKFASRALSAMDFILSVDPSTPLATCCRKATGELTRAPSTMPGLGSLASGRILGLSRSRQSSR